MSTLNIKPEWNLGDDSPAEPTWIWHGFLAAGTITLLTSLWKSGKTTLVALLLARRDKGGTLAGQTVAPGVTAVISEESKDMWGERCRRLGLRSGKTAFFCRPFSGRPTLEAWRELIDWLLQMRREHGLDLVVVDTVASLLPWRDENNAILVREALEPLVELARAGIAVWLLHHPRKADAQPGMAARGSGHLPSFADIVLEMRHPGGNPDTRRRRLYGFSRFRATPRVTLMELNDAEDDYLILDCGADEFSARWQKLHDVLADLDEPLTRQQILSGWPAGETPPSDSALYRWLTKAVELGLVERIGTGNRYDPHRYWLVEEKEMERAG